MTLYVNSPEPRARMRIARGADERPHVARTGRTAAVTAAPALPLAVGNDAVSPR